jgi:hypothetical protein
LRFKLRIDLVPGPLSTVNLRSSTEGLGDYRWRKLRKQIVEECGGKCVICDSDQRLHGHEVWRYDEKKRVGRATLIRVDVICWTCHNIKHLGNTVRLIAFGAISHEGYMTLQKHFRRVNRCRQIDFDRHARRGLAIWQRRSRMRWTVDWGPYTAAVADAKRSRERSRERMVSRAVRATVPPACFVKGRAGHLLRLRRYRLEPSLLDFVALHHHDQSGIRDTP